MLFLFGCPIYKSMENWLECKKSKTSPKEVAL